MATLADIGNFWQCRSGPMINRVLGACLVAAAAIKTESAGTTNHTARLAWANVILFGAEGDVMLKVYAHLRYAIGSNVGFQSVLDAATDAGIQAAINAQIDILA
jgi:hypothetical protein